MKIFIFEKYLQTLWKYGSNIRNELYDVLYETDKSYVIRPYKEKIYIPKKYAQIRRDNKTNEIMKEVDRILYV